MTMVMVGSRLPGHWKDDGTSQVRAGTSTDALQDLGPIADGPPATTDLMDGSRLDSETVERLALFAYNVARKFFTYRTDLLEEAVQETLIRTCERWERANQRGRPEAWVVNAATQVCQEKLREERRGARCSQEAPLHFDVDEQLVRSTLLADSLRRLSTRQRLVVVWRYLFDLSVAQTATALGLTEAKVRDVSHNGSQRLGKMLGEGWSEWG